MKFSIFLNSDDDLDSESVLFLMLKINSFLKFPTIPINMQIQAQFESDSDGKPSLCFDASHLVSMADS